MDIVIRNLNKAFNGEEVLKDFNATIRSGEFNCIMGKSGIGKTTLLNILMGLIKEDSGHIQGLDHKNISAVFQENRLCEDFDAITNLKIVCNNNKCENHRLVDILKSLELSNDSYKIVKDFSGGMKRRLAIARALVPDSDLIIMDEPFVGLDKELYLKTIEYVRTSLLGKTVIIVTHKKDECNLLKCNNIINL